MRLTSSLLVLAMAACGAAPPRWYDTDRTTWTIPLVDAKSPGLIVQAKVHGEGPFLFLLDPDSPTSIIDDGLARELALYSDQQYVRIVNQHDTSLPRKRYEVLALEAGELAVRNIAMLNAPAGSLRAEGRTVQGILGGDLLSRTIVIHVDRDRGLVHLALTGKHSIPSGAVAVEGFLHHNALYVPARVDGRQVRLQVRLASAFSTLKRDVLAELPVRRFETTAVAVDETGTSALLPGGAVVPSVQLDGLSISDIEFYDHVDRRERDDLAFDGVLGENLLSRFEVVVDRDRSTLWLAPRGQARAL